MAHSAKLPPKVEKLRRSLTALARQYERGARAARKLGNPEAAQSERLARDALRRAESLSHGAR